MWTRTELKANARIVLKRTYWESLVAYIITFVIISAASSLIAFIPFINFFGSIGVSLFLAFPLTVGLYFFYLRARTSQPHMKNLFFAFNERNYMTVVAAMAWQYLFTFLWSLIPAAGVIIFATNALARSLSGFYGYRPFAVGLVFTPGLVVAAVFCGVIVVAGMIIVVMKGIAYSMTPFILTDNPNIGYARALKLSIQMTDGQKWEIFMLSLSFIGWALLGILLLFVGVLFLTPYILATYSELYLRLRDNALRSGLTTPQELNLIPPPPQAF